jgi:hypothetical protein
MQILKWNYNIHALTVSVHSYLSRIPEIMEVTITQEAQSIRSEGKTGYFLGPRLA